MKNHPNGPITTNKTLEYIQKYFYNTRYEWETFLFFLWFLLCCVTSLTDVVSSDLWIGVLSTWLISSHLLMAMFKNATVDMQAAKVDGTNRCYTQNRDFNMHYVNFSVHCKRPNISVLIWDLNNYYYKLFYKTKLCFKAFKICVQTLSLQFLYWTIYVIIDTV